MQTSAMYHKSTLACLGKETGLSYFKKSDFKCILSQPLRPRLDIKSVIGWPGQEQYTASISGCVYCDMAQYQ